MKISNAKQSVYLAAMEEEFENINHMNMTCCVLYKYIEEVVASNPAEANNLKTLAKSYIALFRDRVLSLKSQYIAYKKMEDILRQSSSDNFLSFSLSFINSVYAAYNDHTKIEPFSTGRYSQAMYQLTNLTPAQNERLKKIHNNVMAPIANYYFKKYNLAPSSLQINDASLVAENPGKKIQFQVAGITPMVVFRDIVAGRIFDRNLYYDIERDQDFITLTIK